MSIAYGITAFISLCMVGACVLADKKRDIWLLLVFVSVSVCNLGYFMLSISKDLPGALNSNRLSYLGSVFLPFFMLMMVFRFCGIKQKNVITIILAVVGVVMLAITTSPGILPIYYSTVELAFENGSTKLVREYGPCHLWYYVYLIGYMLSMIGVVFYAIGKKKIQSHSHTFLLLCTVFCNITIWLVEQFLPRGFEWLSVSYIITECLILAIYRSMQRQGVMRTEERTRSYTINVLLVVYLLLFANFVRVATRETTETMYIISQVVILLIYVGILTRWAVSLHDRIINPRVRCYLIILVGLMLFWMLVRTLRFTIFYYVFPMGQWCWYAYYISMILIPQICLMAAKYIGKPEEYRLSKKWLLMYVPSLLLIFGILTNDLHQWAFRFHHGYEMGWDVYERSFLYYMAVAWIGFCIIMMIIQIVKSSRVPGAKKMIWLPVAMVALGVLYSILYAVDSDLFGFIEMTAALCFTIVAIWESSIKTGLIQSNSHYDELLKLSCLGMMVTDNDYEVHYRSDDARVVAKEALKAAAEAPVMLENGYRVSGSVIKGGYAFWQEDLSELLEILEELEEIHKELENSNEVSMNNYQIAKKIRILEEKNRLHDELHRQTAHQINLLNDWLKQLILTDDGNEKRELLRRIVVVGAYLKRRNNLILVNEQTGVIKEQELKLSIEEFVRNLHLAGITCACSVQLNRDFSSDIIMKLFDFYEYVVENAFDGLESLLARFFCRDNNVFCCIDAVSSCDLTKLQTDEITVSVSEENCYTLSYKMEVM